MHSPVEVVSLKDIERVGRLMAYCIADLTEDLIAELTPKDGLED
jgi:putative aminopeptidase FrvX